MKSYIILTTLTTILFFASPLYAMYDETSYNTPYPTTARLIVKFKAGLNPQEIQHRIETNKKTTVSPTGYILQQLDIISKKIKGQQSTEEIQNELSQVEQRYKIIHYTPLFSQPTKVIDANSYYLIDLPPIVQPNDVMKAYKNLAIVSWIIPDVVVSVQTTNNDSTESTTKAESNNNVGIAVIDTGLDNSDNGYNFLTNTTITDDSNGHGTLVATHIIDQATKSQKVTNLTNSLKIIPLKVLDTQGFGYTSTVMKSLQYVIDHAEKAEIDIVNMSFGGPRFDADKKLYDICTIYNDVLNLKNQKGNYVKNLYGKDIIMIAAAGNDNQDFSGKQSQYDGVAPAACNGITSVGASDNNHKKAPFSNYGTLSLYAPGITEKSSGTSIAAAYVSGTFAQLFIPEEKSKTDKTVKKDTVAESKKEENILKELDIIPNTQPTPTNKPSSNTSSPTSTKTPSPSQQTITTTTVPTPTPTPTLTPSPKPTIKPPVNPTATSKPATPTPTTPPPTSIPTAVPTPTPTPISPTPTSVPLPTSGPFCSNSCAEDAALCPRDTIPSGECPTGRGTYCVCETNR